MAANRGDIDARNLAAMASQGMTAADIARAVGCTPRTVRGLLEGTGVRTPKRDRDDVTPERVAELFAQGLTVTEVAEEMGCCAQTVRDRLKRAGVRAPGAARFWTKERDAVLVEHMGDPRRAAELLGTDLRAVKARLKCLDAGVDGVKEGAWSPEEDALLIEMKANGASRVEIAKALGRGLNSVSNRSSAIFKEEGSDRRRTWSDQEEAELRRLWERGETTPRIARALGTKSRDQVSAKVARLQRKGELPKRSVWTSEREAVMAEVIDPSERATAEKVAEAAKRTGLTERQVRSHVRRLRSAKGERANHTWTPERDAELVALVRQDGTLATEDADAMAERLGVGSMAVKQHLSVLRGRGEAPQVAQLQRKGELPKRSVWTPEREAALADVIDPSERATAEKVAEAAKRTGLTERQVRSHVRRLRSAKGERVNHTWTPERDAELVALVRQDGTLATEDADAMAERLGVGSMAVKRHLSVLRGRGEAPQVAPGAPIARARKSKGRPAAEWSRSDDLVALSLAFDGAHGSGTAAATAIGRDVHMVRKRADLLHGEAVACATGRMEWPASHLSFLDARQRKAVIDLVEAESARSRALEELKGRP